jgi:hypothetical protein
MINKSKVKLMVCTPMYGGQCFGHFTKSCLDLHKLCHEQGIQLKFKFLYNESLVQRARNILANQFMQSDYTHLMWIDADIHFEAQHVIDLLEQDKQIVGGNYPKKCINWNSVAEAVKAGMPNDFLPHCAGDSTVYLHDRKKGQFIDIRKTYEVDYLATGFMMIKREVFEQYEQKYPDKWYNNMAKEKVWAYFDCVIAQRIYLSEDYYFCAMVKQMGIPIFWAPWIHLGHIGTYQFDGCFFCSRGTYLHKPNPDKDKP